MTKKILMVVMALVLVRVAGAADLVVYSSAPGSLAKSLAKGYQRRTGRHVELYVSSTGKVMARLAAEAAHPHADVVILADWTAGLALARQGEVQPYRPERVVRQLRPQLAAAGPFLPIGGDLVSLVVNTSLVAPGQTPHDWFDLSGPQWRGRLTMPDPTLSGTASDFVIAFVSHEGSRGWEWFEALKANGCIWPGPNASALRPVEMGARSIMVAGVGHTALKAKLGGNSLDTVLPSGGVLMIPRPIIVMKSSRQIPAAEQFVDYALSEPGQTAVAKALLLPAVRTVKPAAVWPDLDRVRVLPVDWAGLAAQRKAVLGRFSREILGR